ncbi:hypothetical protein ACLGL1_06465 [Peptococcus simiae]|uniref:hypothetical protein n=1 Tax=Peptococcus simiae TaxID=1643805 RepID=UPI00397F961F
MTRFLDLKGERFGNLTALYRIQNDEKGYAKWLCQCDCGNKVVENTKRLKRGTTTSCGCVPKTNARNGNKAENLIGGKYGKLTVIKRVENKNSRVSWLCKCDCGNEKVTTAQLLKSGKTKSCGCLRGFQSNHYKDISGKKFDRLLVIEPTNLRDNRGSIIWKCLCDCGNECIVTEDNLVRKKTTSCGCRKKEICSNITNLVSLYQDTSYTFLKFRKNVRSDNKCGVRGISKLKNGRFRATIGFKKIRYDLGTYSTLQEALFKRKYAEEILHEGFCDAFEKWKALSSGNKKWEEKNPLIYDVEFKDKKFNVICNIEDLEKVENGE